MPVAEAIGLTTVPWTELVAHWRKMDNDAAMATKRGLDRAEELTSGARRVLAELQRRRGGACGCIETVWACSPCMRATKLERRRLRARLIAQAERDARQDHMRRNW